MSSTAQLLEQSTSFSLPTTMITMMMMMTLMRFHENEHYHLLHIFFSYTFHSEDDLDYYHLLPPDDYSSFQRFTPKQVVKYKKNGQKSQKNHTRRTQTLLTHFDLQRKKSSCIQKKTELINLKKSHQKNLSYQFSHLFSLFFLLGYYYYNDEIYFFNDYCYARCLINFRKRQNYFGSHNSHIHINNSAERTGCTFI